MSEENSPELDATFAAMADRPIPEPTPMPDFTERPKEKEYDGNDSAELRRAAKDLSDARAAGTIPRADDVEPVDRGYRWTAGRGDPVPEHYTLDAKRAAEDLTKVRMAEVEAATPTQELAQAIDQVRAQVNGEQQPQVQPQPEVQAPADAVQQQQPSQDPAAQVRQALEQNPALRQALEQEMATVEQSRAQYAEAARQAATVAAAACLADHPALANLSAQEFPHAMSALAKTDPATATAIQAKLNRVQALYNQSQQAQQQAQQLQAQRFQEYARIEDARFEKAIANEPTETKRAVIESGSRILSQYYGIDAKALAQAVEGNPALRSASTQALIYDAIKAKVAEESIASKVARPVPPVQRPGVSVDRNADDDVNSALAKFRSDPSPKTGRDVLLARRAAANRR